MQLIISVGFFLFAIRTILFWVSLWQVKEYRLDRLVAHIKETSQGRKLLYSPYAIVLFIFILGYSIVVINDSLSFWYHLLSTILFSVLGVQFIYEIATFSFRRPRLTLKSFLMVILALGLISLAYLLSLVDVYLWAIIIAFSLPPFVALFVALFSFPSEIYTDIMIQRARIKLKKYKKIKVIAVSGSYGKSSTKEYLAHILEQGFSVVKTPLSNNTPIGIAKTILKNVNSKTQILIVEMGAYKKGEIEKLCEIVKPDISITTSISDQHLSLYGSLENVVESEAELLHALPKKNIALMNANSPLIFLLMSKIKQQVYLYGTSENKNAKGLSVEATNILVKKDGVAFTVKIKKDEFTCFAPLLGGHIVENILPAIFIAKKMGMRNEEIQSAIKTLQPLPKTMKKFILQNGAVVVDDTFNASPESVVSALSYMKIYSKKKMFVMTPLIELGKNARKRHVEIGKELAICTKVFLTNKNFYKEIMQGLESVDAKTEIVVANPIEISQQLQQQTAKGDIIIFEGKEAGKALQTIL